MNWVGGVLQRSRRAGDLTAQQKLHFAKARAKHLHGVKPARPTRFFDDEFHTVGDPLEVEWSRPGSAHTGTEAHSVETDRPLHQASHSEGEAVTGQSIDHHSSSTGPPDRREKQAREAQNGGAADLRCRPSLGEPNPPECTSLRKSVVPPRGSSARGWSSSLGRAG